MKHALFCTRSPSCLYMLGTLWSVYFVECMRGRVLEWGYVWEGVGMSLCEILKAYVLAELDSNTASLQDHWRCSSWPLVEWLHQGGILCFLRPSTLHAVAIFSGGVIPPVAVGMRLREGIGMSLYLISNLLYFTYEHSNSLPDKAGCHPSAHRRLHTPDYVPNCDCWQGNRKWILYVYSTWTIVSGLNGPC